MNVETKKTEQDGTRQKPQKKPQTQTVVYQVINATGKCACSRNKLAFLNFWVLDLETFHTIFFNI